MSKPGGTGCGRYVVPLKTRRGSEAEVGSIQDSRVLQCREAVASGRLPQTDGGDEEARSAVGSAMMGKGKIGPTGRSIIWRGLAK